VLAFSIPPIEKINGTREPVSTRDDSASETCQPVELTETSCSRNGLQAKNQHRRQGKQESLHGFMDGVDGLITDAITTIDSVCV
jgi:hypothetical protein